MTAIDYAIVSVYLLFALSVGLFFSKRASKDSESFFLGGRNLPWWAIGVSMVATSFASDTPLVTTEMVREEGLQKLWWVLISVMPLIVGIFLFSRLWRRARIITDAQFYELRYEGRSAAFLRGFRAFFSGIVQNLATMALVIFGMSRVITIVTGIEDETLALGICIAVALTYATLSGFYGVVITDLVQFGIATFSMIALAVIAVVQLGGLGTILNTLSSTPEFGPEKLTLLPDFSRLDENTARLLIYFLIFWWNDASGYNMQRMSACRDEKGSVMATLFYAVFQAIRPWMWVVVGLASIIMFPKLEQHNDAYPMVMNAFLGPGMKGLLVTAFLAAFMSTIDAQLNWGASYVMTDGYRRFVKKNASEKHYMLVTKLVVVGLMLLGAAIAPLITSVMAAWEFLVMLMIGGGIFMVWRWFWWRINAYTEITALVLGLVAGFGSLLVAWIAKEERTYISGEIYQGAVAWVGTMYEIKIAILTAIVVPISLLVTYLTPPTSKEKLTEFYRTVRPGGCWSILDDDVQALPGKVLSWQTIIDVLGGMMLCYGLSLAIGFAILLRWTPCAVCLGFAAFGAVLVKKWFNKEVEMMQAADSPASPSVQRP